jgi:hypothetical protein
MKQSQLFMWIVVGIGSFVPASGAHAFCGFYVGGGESNLFNNATQVVLMRDAPRTVLSMQNNYQGPAENFAMVIPVPVVLQEENVKTLDSEIFNKVDQMSAPRLVEYWEKDPCAPVYEFDDQVMRASPESDASGGGDSVTVEAEFAVGEYEIVILSTNDASALDSWLTDNNYNIPDGASDHFTPYVSAGSYFFVAKVDSTKVTIQNGNLVLSPLRVHYDSEDFNLPIKLGLINSEGEQDLIVYLLGHNQRYDVANRPNVFIPTNIEVISSVKDSFGDFYRSLFAETIAQNPGAAVTEYSWRASSCDPCPGPTLNATDFMTLGQDVTSFSEQQGVVSWVLTRLHLRYTQQTLGDDLVFQQASPVGGGREIYGDDGELETGDESGSSNNFQGRYIIRHPWTGSTLCLDPTHDRWGGPDGDNLLAPSTALSPNSGGQSSAQGGDVESPDVDPPSASDLSDLVVDDIPELKITAGASRNASGCTCSSGGSALGMMWIMLLGADIWRRRRRW